MKKLPAPYFRAILLLAVCVGLLALVKPILHFKMANTSESATVASKGIPKDAIRWTPYGRSSTESPWFNFKFPEDVIADKDDTDDTKEEITNNNLTEKNPTNKKIVDKDITERQNAIPKPEIYTSPEDQLAFQYQLALQAEKRLQSNVTYDGRYVKIAYPMGDVPQNIGVCTDVVIRSFRGLGIDLQQRVHEDMRRNFSRYPNNWQLSRPDSNIDHRRVPNLRTFFKRFGKSLRVTSNPLNYRPGDIVTWDLGNGMVHIGIVSTYVSEITGNPLIVHNIGAGSEMNDMLFKHRITGHYQYGQGSNLRLAQRN